MPNFKEIKPEELNKSPFQIIGSDWMTITAEKDNKINTMTASWGGLGVMWGKNVAFITIRPTRYTKEFVDGSDTFSLTFFDGKFKKELAYIGNVSGRDEDKIAKTNLTVQHSDNTPYFEEGSIAIICKKLYAQKFEPELFLDSSLDEKWYPEKDYHTMYIAEVKKVLIKEGMFKSV
ncbi:flavin reductase family protein [Clostridium sp. 19966]|uniref:flavin reductase n=1 Tax=Clostridium sp. 19966 TaxID=2768166 RepID=UPI0028DE9273|nr:flavin reductase [Clostridium sp. 19966]MDT8718853.1 flavin reductase family protein [Clostridium sp. 19966]